MLILQLIYGRILLEWRELHRPGRWRAHPFYSIGYVPSIAGLADCAEHGARGRGSSQVPLPGRGLTPLTLAATWRMVEREDRRGGTIMGTPAVDGVRAPRTDTEVRVFFHGWLDGSNAGDWATVAALMHPEIALWDPMMAAPARGRGDALERVKAQYAPFPDAQVEMLGDPFVSLGEPELAYRWRFTGTHLGPIDPPGFAPTGLPVESEGVSVLRFEGALVREATLFLDAAGFARQILAAPPAGSPLERGMVISQRLRAAIRRKRTR